MVGYVHAMKIAGYPASYFFDPRFTINAGNVRNEGRGFREYRSIASRPEMAVTFENEGKYGKTSFFAKEGKKWRIAPFYTNAHSALLVEEQDFGERTNPNCGVIQRHIIRFEGVNRLIFNDEINKNKYIIPGLNRIEKRSLNG